MPDSRHFSLDQSDLPEQKEERIAELISTDSFLSRHCEAVLFERLPASTLPTQAGYLTALDSADVYLGIMGLVEKRGAARATYYVLNKRQVTP